MRIAPEARLVDSLRDYGDIVAPLSLVAEHGGYVIGHVVCSRAQIDSHPSLGLGPLGVLPDHQRCGVGQALMHGVLAAADALDEPAVVLLGDPRYYGRFGFEPAQPLGILPTNAKWTNFQVRRLTTWNSSIAGTFLYAAAFDQM